MSLETLLELTRRLAMSSVELKFHQVFVGNSRSIHFEQENQQEVQPEFQEHLVNEREKI